MMYKDVSELFEDLLRASHDDDARAAYRTLRFVLNRSVDVALRSVTVQFSGLFAKMNYLLTEHKAQPEMIHSMGATRNRIRQYQSADAQELVRSFPFDLKNLALFISLVFPDDEIPQELTDRFPAGSLKNEWGKADMRYLRILVSQIDENFIYGYSAEGDAPEVKVNYGPTNQYLRYDYSYLRTLMKDQTQLNLIRPRQAEDGTLLPEIIIFEPDYLTDISSIASAFKEYGETPYTNLINKIAPSRQTKATLLGNFAGQLMDEELHGLSGRQYAESIGEFCRKNALAMATCNDLDNSFHQEAMTQKKNIHKAFHDDMPALMKEFRPDEVLLEPSFASEMLGIQGRMDFLQSDFHLLIEQKSGKAAFVPGQKGFETPSLSIPHYVQLLLYRALLHYNYDMPNEQIHPLLLYSKYKNPLLHTESAPELLHRAFQLRNQLVWLELYLGDKGFGLLGKLSPEDINKSGKSSKLWEQYTRPDIIRTLLPIHEASPLEKAYYFRMLKFVQRENILSKIGNKRKENSGFSARWHDSIEEKSEAGNIIFGLEISDKTADFSGNGIEAVTLRTSSDGDGDSLITSNFRIGDIVTLFPYQIGTEPDCRKSTVHRASIERMNASEITLRLRASQTNTHAFEVSADHAWAIEHDFMESSYGSLYRGIHSFLSASKSRRDLLLSQRHPVTDESRQLKGDYSAFNELSLRVKQAQEMFLIIGPPGTGKTSYGMLNTLKEELLEENSSVAVMSFTNRAVDEICSKLVEEGIDFVRIGSELSCAEQYRAYLLNNKIADISKISAIRDFIRSQRVVVGTTTAFNSHQSIFSLRGFSLAIIDEASQILEPHLLGLLSAQFGEKEAIGKFVMIGDHKQLPAVVQQTQEESQVDDAMLNGIGLKDCRLSLFERLLSIYHDDPSVVYMLSHQGRMHEEIADFPNRCFYGGKLACVPLPHQIEESTEKRVQFINVARPEHSLSDKINRNEADVIADIVIRTFETDPDGFDPTYSIGIIVPYRNQISAVRSAIEKKNSHEKLSGMLSELTIDTVERFQGSQRKVIVYGFTVQRPYQLDFLTDNCFEEDGSIIDRKLNVVMTRAMSKLYLVGNAQLLSYNPLFRSLIQYCND